MGFENPSQPEIKQETLAEYREKNRAQIVERLGLPENTPWAEAYEIVVQDFLASKPHLGERPDGRGSFSEDTRRKGGEQFRFMADKGTGAEDLDKTRKYYAFRQGLPETATFEEIWEADQNRLAEGRGAQRQAELDGYRERFRAARENPEQ